MRKHLLLLGILAVGAASIAEAALTDDLSVANSGRAAFAHPLPFLTGSALERFLVGGAIFAQPWAPGAPGDESRFVGLGPLANNLSCIGCHIGHGRGEPSANENDVMQSTLVRLSVPGAVPMAGSAPDPTYGDQIQPHGISNVPGEMDPSIRWHEETQTLGDGTRVSLRHPELVLRNFHYGPLAQGTMMSVRMSPAVFGLGLLAAVPEADLIVNSDPNDENDDGIRGRVNHVWDAEIGRSVVGRFGLKANQPTLKQQVAGALIGDMGITSRLFMNQNCTAAEVACKRTASSTAPEISDADFAALVDYMNTLAPPARRPGNETTRLGEGLFEEWQCAACHFPAMRTGPLPGFPEVAGRTIHPYTDLLLHDMGEGLADGRPDYEASGRDWRTTPLWGIGLVPMVTAHPTYLHDGRARNLTEAILWHGGEAESARGFFADASAKDREALLAFLNSL